MEREIQYACKSCGEWFDEAGACPKCGGYLVRMCPECGEKLSECD